MSAHFSDLSSHTISPADIASVVSSNIRSFKELSHILQNPEIQVLKIRNNEIDKFDEGFFIDYPDLRFLDISENRISKIEYFDRLENLVLFDVSKNHITVLEGLESNSKLKRLLISKNQINKINLKNPMPSLIVLDIHKNPIKTIKFSHIFPELTELYVDKCMLTTLSDISEFSKLQHVTAKDNKISDSQPIQQNTIVDLDLENNLISSIVPFINMSSLIHLNLSNNPITNDKLLRGPILKTLRSFKCVCSQIDKFDGILHAFPNLEMLDITRSKISKLKDIVDYVAKSNTLRYLDLRGNPVSKDLYPRYNPDVEKVWDSIDLYDLKFPHKKEQRLDYRRSIVSCCQTLEILDAVRTTEMDGIMLYEEEDYYLYSNSNIGDSADVSYQMETPPFHSGSASEEFASDDNDDTIPISYSGIIKASPSFQEKEEAIFYDAEVQTDEKKPVKSLILEKTNENHISQINHLQNNNSIIINVDPHKYKYFDNQSPQRNQQKIEISKSTTFEQHIILSKYDTKQATLFDVQPESQKDTEKQHNIGFTNNCVQFEKKPVKTNISEPQNLDIKENLVHFDLSNISDHHIYKEALLSKNSSSFYIEPKKKNLVLTDINSQYLKVQNVCGKKTFQLELTPTSSLYYDGKQKKAILSTNVLPEYHERLPKEHKMECFNDAIDVTPFLDHDVTNSRSVEHSKNIKNLEMKRTNIILEDIPPQRKNFNRSDISLIANFEKPKREMKLISTDFSEIERTKQSLAFSSTQVADIESPKIRRNISKTDILVDFKKPKQRHEMSKPEIILDLEKEICQLNLDTKEMAQLSSKEKTKLIVDSHGVADIKAKERNMDVNTHKVADIKTKERQMKVRNEQIIDFSSIDFEKREKYIKELEKKNRMLQEQLEKLSAKASDRTKYDEYKRKIRHLKADQERHLKEIGALKERERGRKDDKETIKYMEKMYKELEKQNQKLVAELMKAREEAKNEKEKDNDLGEDAELIISLVDGLLKQNRALHSEMFKASISPPSNTPVSLRAIEGQWKHSPSASVSSSASVFSEYQSASSSVSAKREKDRRRRAPMEHIYSLSSEAPIWSSPHDVPIYASKSRHHK